MRLSDVVLVLVSALVGVLASEALYRAYLWSTIEDRNPFSRPASIEPTFDFASYPALWIFDRDVGWTYRPDGHLVGTIKDGRLVSCKRVDQINARGHIASTETDWHAAAARGALIGSSYTMGRADGERLFHETLGDILSRMTDRQVLVENFSRDAYGVIQMVKLAASVARTHKPDFIIIAFNSATIAMNRHWRVLIPASDGFYDFYLLPRPDMKAPTPHTAQLHRYVISDRVTAEWCTRMAEAAKAGDDRVVRDDPLVKSLIGRHDQNERRRRAPVLVVDFWAVGQSFLYNRIVSGNPFKHMDVFASPDNPLQPLAIDDYGENEEFLSAVDSLNRSGVQYSVVHIPSFPELRTGEEWAAAGTVGVSASRELDLVHSLEKRLGRPVLSLLPKLGSPRLDAHRMANKAEGEGRDWHPNEYGAREFAQALAEILVAEHFRKP